MKVLIAGYIPAEGRYSMVRTARSLKNAFDELPDLNVEVGLDEPEGEPVAAALEHGNWKLKLRKRLLFPLRVRRQSCEVLHIIDSDYAAGIPSAKLSRTVVTCHDLMPLLLSGSPEKAFPSRWGRYFFKKSLARMAACSRVVCDSSFTRDCVLQYTEASPERVEIVPIGVDDAFRPFPQDAADLLRFKARHGLDDAPVLLHVGNAESYKNIPALLEAAARVKGELAGGFRLLKVGGRFSEEHRQQIQRLGLTESLVHLKGVSEAELVLAYNCADVLLWPSRFEGFGLPVLEAMACGTPVVCSNGGALAETAGEAAAIFDPADVDGMASACVRVIQDQAYAAELRERGNQHAARFTWERTARAYHSIYRSVCGEA